MKRFLRKANRFIFVILIIVLVVTFFSRNRYRHIDDIDSRVLQSPKQTELTTSEQGNFTFTKGPYEYEVTPLYDYEFTGLLVNKHDYTKFSIYNRNAVFPMDLCMIWGENVGSKTFQSTSLNFSQDTRFCRYMWSGDLTFNGYEFSNNHLVVNNERLEKIINTLNVGDQVWIKGKLVNVSAKLVGEGGDFDSQYFEWRTSVDRSDSGAGACETIYVEDILILKKSNILSYYAFKGSLMGLGIWFLVQIILFFTTMRLKK